MKQKIKESLVLFILLSITPYFLMDLIKTKSNAVYSTVETILGIISVSLLYAGYVYGCYKLTIGKQIDKLK